MSIMAITFNWTVSNLQRRLPDGIVTSVTYAISATDGTYGSSAYGNIPLLAPKEGQTIIPYSELTPEITLDWVKSNLGEERVEKIEEALTTRITEQRTPSTGDGVPWAATEVSLGESSTAGTEASDEVSA